MPEHEDHVIPLSIANWVAFEAGVLYSAVRPMRDACNTSKRDRDHHARFILDRWAQGLSVRQAFSDDD